MDRGYQEIRINNTAVYVDREYRIKGIQLVYWSGPTLTVKVNNQDSPGFVVKPGDVLNIDFIKLYFTLDLLCLEQSVFLAIAQPEFRFFNSKIRTIKSDYDSTLEHNEFMGGIYLVGEAALYPHAQLWNPPASGVELILHAVWVMMSGSYAVRLRFTQYATALTDAVAAGRNKYLGGAVSVGEVRGENNAATLGNALARTSFYGDTGYQTPWVLPLRPDIVIPENQGLCVTLDTVLLSLLVTYEWKEKRI